MIQFARRRGIATGVWNGELERRAHACFRFRPDAATPALDRATFCPAAACGARALLVFDVQSDNHAEGYDGQVTQKGYDNMTGLGTPNGLFFISALRALEK